MALDEVIHDLGAAAFSHVLVEPGPALAHSFVRQNLADRIWMIRSQTELNDAEAVSAMPIPTDFLATGQLNLDGDQLTEFLNPESPVFFSTTPSVDFLLSAGANSQ